MTSEQGGGEREERRLIDRLQIFILQHATETRRNDFTLVLDRQMFRELRTELFQIQHFPQYETTGEIILHGIRIKELPL